MRSKSLPQQLGKRRQAGRLPYNPKPIRVDSCPFAVKPVVFCALLRLLAANVVVPSVDCFAASCEDAAPMKFYVTTPIYYVNDRPHIGHVYTTTIADIMARYHRLCGDEVFFLTGTDEHAAKVVDAAAERNLTPLQWADKNAQEFQDTFRKLGITNDDFIRTTQERHKSKVQQYVGELMKTGDVYLGEYEGWYDVGQEEYIPDNKAKEYEYKSPVNSRPLERKTEKNYFFRLSRYAEALLKRMEEQPDFVQPDERRNEMVNRIREGLNDVPISRISTGDWGIKVPGDDQHVIYVWIDALINYLSTVDTDDRRHWWPADVHLVGKDILWFHSVIWPALLLALKRPLPRQVYAHGWWKSEGQKMSKSLGNFVDLEKIDQYVAAFGLDAFRYYLASNGPMGINDSDFAHAKFVEVYNADLANDLGNLINRTLSMIARYRYGTVPAGETADLRAEATTMAKAYQEAMARLDLHGALEALWQFISRGNRYVEESAPWKLAKDPAQTSRLDAVLYNLAESVRLISVLVPPVMPTVSLQIRGQLGVEEKTGRLAQEIEWGGLAAGTKIGVVSPLFPKRT
ncbi:MAG: methionine--tRNA ligase [Verrucomicrobiia bacterium]